MKRDNFFFSILLIKRQAPVVGSTNTFNLSTIHIFIPVSGCIVGPPSALLCLGAYDAVKTALKFRATETCKKNSDTDYLLRYIFHI